MTWNEPTVEQRAAFEEFCRTAPDNGESVEGFCDSLREKATTGPRFSYECMMELVIQVRRET